jgi:hypothetical protein
MNAAESSLSNPRLGFVHGVRTLPRAVAVLVKAPRLVRWVAIPLVITLIVYATLVTLFLRRVIEGLADWLHAGDGGFVGAIEYVGGCSWPWLSP